MKRPPATLRLVLRDDDGLGRIVVDMEAFFDFSFWLAEELEDLVACRALKAGPPAGGMGRVPPAAGRRDQP